jgi:hypothetical protein
MIHPMCYYGACFVAAGYRRCYRMQNLLSESVMKKCRVRCSWPYTDPHRMVHTGYIGTGNEFDYYISDLEHTRETSSLIAMTV